MSSYTEKLRRLERAGRMRILKPLSGRNGCRIDYKGRTLLNLTSNDYLGLAGDRELLKRFYSSLDEPGFLDTFGLGAASSRLLTGDSDKAHNLEECLKIAYEKEACLLFNSGYHANIGILPALFAKNDLILSDKLNHASIMDGMQLSKAQFKRYRHRDYDHLASLLKTYRKRFNKVVIVSESVFSMDGDVADIGQLIALKEEYDCMLYLDEAHAVGLYGKKGLGMVEEQEAVDGIDFLVGTFGKAPASIGAFVLCTEEIRSYLINHSRSLIFTTALPPVIHSWNHFVMQEIFTLEAKRIHLKQLGSKLRRELVEKGLKTDGTTNIVPVMIGDDARAISYAEKMQKRGYLIFPVRPPAVPEGTARFRLSLTGDMEWDDIKNIAVDISDIVIKGEL